jgi:anaerobic selenocysteine-containing dehydrogenase
MADLSWSSSSDGRGVTIAQNDISGEAVMGVIGEPGVSSKTRTVHVACPHDCPDGCSMRVTVDNASGRAIKVEGDPTHPVTRGYLCNKVNHYLDLVYNERPGREIRAHWLG